MKKFDYTPEEIEEIMKDDLAWKALLDEAADTLTEEQRENLDSSGIPWRETVECCVQDLYEPPTFCDIVRSGVYRFGIERGLEFEDIWPERFSPNDDGMYFRVYEYYPAAPNVLIQTISIPEDIIAELKEYLGGIASIRMI